MAKAENREYVHLVCSECQRRNYRTSKRVKGGRKTYKVEVKKFCRWCRRHVLHVERRKD